MGRSTADNDRTTPHDFGVNWVPSAHEISRQLARKNRNIRNMIVAGVSSLIVLGTLAVIIVS